VCSGGLSLATAAPQFAGLARGQTQVTPVLSISNHAFSGWNKISFQYTATSASELLKFLVTGTPKGAPPIALLDGISLTPTAPTVPEPATWAMMV
jgi:hypothetical protein